MKITIVSRGDASSGGAGRIAETLSSGLRLRGNVICHLLRKNPRPAYFDSSELIPALKGDVLLRNMIGLDISGMMLLAHSKIWRADIIHFHDFAVAFGPLAVLFLSKFKPIVLTLHDFSGFTGGCLYPHGCIRYFSGCGNCPQVGTSPLTFPYDLTRYYFKIHKKIAASKNIIAIAPSNYIKQKAKKGAWRNRTVHVIPNAVETCMYSSELRINGRYRLGLDRADKALLFVANNILDPRKGFDDLAKSFLKLAPHRSDVYLVLVGLLNEIPLYLKPYRKQIKKLGLIEESRRMAEIYAASDCLVLPTREDNFPCTIIESLSVGTPVIAYCVGGIPEMLQTPAQGYIVAPNDQKGLLESIRQVLSKKPSSERQKIRRFYRNHYSVDTFINRHIDLYNKTLKVYSS